MVVNDMGVQSTADFKASNANKFNPFSAPVAAERHRQIVLCVQARDTFETQCSQIATHGGLHQRLELAAACGHSDAPWRPYVRALLADPLDSVRVAASQSICENGCAALLEGLLEATDVGVVRKAAARLVRIGSLEAWAALSKSVQGGNLLVANTILDCCTYLNRFTEQCARHMVNLKDGAFLLHFAGWLANTDPERAEPLLIRLQGKKINGRLDEAIFHAYASLATPSALVLARGIATTLYNFDAVDLELIRALLATPKAASQQAAAAALVAQPELFEALTKNELLRGNDVIYVPVWAVMAVHASPWCKGELVEHLRNVADGFRAPILRVLLTDQVPYVSRMALREVMRCDDLQAAAAATEYICKNFDELSKTALRDEVDVVALASVVGEHICEPAWCDLASQLLAAPQVNRNVAAGLLLSSQPQVAKLVVQAWKDDPSDATLRVLLSPQLGLPQRKIIGDTLGLELPRMPDKITVIQASRHNMALRQQLSNYLVELPLSALHDELEEMPWTDLVGMHHRLVPALERQHANVFADVRAGRFDEKNKEHLAVNSLLLLESPFMPKSLLDIWYEELFHEKVYDSKKDVAVHLPKNVRGEAVFLAYESYLFEETILKPAQQKARDLGVPLMVVANLSCGGTALSAFKKKDWEAYNVRFVATKHSYSFASPPDGLFAPEDVQFLIEENPLTLVVDATGYDHFPRAMLGYQDYFQVFNHAVGAPARRPVVGKKLGANLAESKLGKLICNDIHEIQNLNTRDVSPGFDFYYASVGSETKTLHSEAVPEFSWTCVQAPSVVCVHPCLSFPEIQGHTSWQARFTLKHGAKFHEAAFYDDETYQRPRLYRSKKGYKKLASPLYPKARDFFKVLRAGDPEMKGRLETGGRS